MHGYVCMYNGQRKEIMAESLYEAKMQAIAAFKPPKVKQHMVIVMLAEKAGKPVEHTFG